MKDYTYAGLSEYESRLLQTPIKTLLKEEDKSYFSQAVSAKEKLGEFARQTKTEEWRDRLRGAFEYTKEKPKGDEKDRQD